MTKKKEPGAKLRPGPKPGSRRVAAPIEAPIEKPVGRPALGTRVDPLQRNRNVMLMDEAELRAYALQAGVNKRDAETLGVDRLRQNINLVLQNFIDSI